jgi:hypothetical protein
MMLEPSTDWTGQLNEERLVLCAEALFVHQLIGAPAHKHIIANIRDRAETQRQMRARKPAELTFSPSRFLPMGSSTCAAC